MTTIAQPVARELTASEICWELAPLPVPQPMAPDDLIAEISIEALSYRLLAVEAIDRVRTLTLRLDRARSEQRAAR